MPHSEWPIRLIYMATLKHKLAQLPPVYMSKAEPRCPGLAATGLYLLWRPDTVESTDPELVVLLTSEFV